MTFIPFCGAVPTATLAKLAPRIRRPEFRSNPSFWHPRWKSPGRSRRARGLASPTRSGENGLPVDALGVHDGSDGVVEVKRLAARWASHSSPGARTWPSEALEIKLRYKQPDGDASREIELQVRSQDRAFESASSDHQFAAAIAAFGMPLRNSEHKGSSSFWWVLSTARRNAGDDPYRSELVELVRKADELTR